MLLEMLGSIIKFNHHNLPKIIGQHKKISKLLDFVLEHQDLPRVTKTFGQK
jgi:uncharacterized protein YdiU (UPF0061 family)